MLGVGETYAAYTGRGSGVFAELGEDGLLDLVIQKGDGTPSGGEMFEAAVKAFGAHVGRKRDVDRRWNHVEHL